MFSYPLFPPPPPPLRVVRVIAAITIDPNRAISCRILASRRRRPIAKPIARKASPR